MISVIVPVYNAAGYLRGCIENVLAQDFTDWELLLITGVSEDGTDEICRQLAGEDARICVLERKDPGVSAARNCGIDHARGEYLVFPDGDDRLEKDYLAKLLATMEAPGQDASKVKGFDRAVVQMGMAGYVTESKEDGEELLVFEV